MATKKCPYCGEEIDSEALKCRYCREWLTDAPPQPVAPQVAQPAPPQPVAYPEPQPVAPEPVAQQLAPPQPIAPQPAAEETQTSAETDLRNAVSRILIENKDYMAAVRYYASAMNCDEKTARRYVDNLNGIIRSWSEKGELSFKCPHCSAPLHVGQTRCEVCGNIVSAEVPAERKVVRSSWWARNKGWVIGLIILQVILIIINIISALSNTHYYY